MFGFLSDLFSTDGFPKRWECGTWTDALGWTHIASDAAIFGAYTAIPLVLAFFVMRRRDIPFPKIFWLFVAFIFACGFGHLIEALIFWQPVYRLSGAVKLTTALVSWGTVFALMQIVPEALKYPGLARLNSELQTEVEERKRAESALRKSEEKLADLLTSERQARSEAERANQIKDEFLSNVSHELRTPLNAILGYAQVLRLSGKAGTTLEELSIIERNARLQAQIIDDLLDMSRIVSGKVRLDVRTVDMAEVIEAAVETVRPAAAAKGIRIHTVLDSHAAAVLGDDGRLQQVLTNLLTNAVKFTSKGGRVQVVLERVNSHLEVHVSDDGQGISPDFLPHIFDRFRQADQGTARRHGGLGLGLSIAKHLVELHGGTIEAFSPGEGQGATFTVNLPVQVLHGTRAEAAGDEAGEQKKSLPLSISLKGVRVMVVDDEQDARELVRRFLTQYEADVAVAGSVDEALKLMQRHRPEVLISDIGMPGKDGYDLIRAVRARSDEEGGRLPAIALTALARVEDRKRAMLAGYFAYVTKPVDPDELAAAVAALAGRTGR